METAGLGAGLVALAFWGFIASTVVGGIWYAIREKEAKHETLRRIVESGQDLDEQTISRLLGGSESENAARDLKVSGYIVIPTGIGMAILAVFLGQIKEAAFYAVLGAAGLVICVGIGLIAASNMARRYDSDDR